MKPDAHGQSPAREDSDPVDYARVDATIDRPLARVWREIARFDGIERWMSGVSSCTMEGAGVDAVRTVILAGYEVRERLVAIDPAAHRLRYRILDPHGLPANDVHGTIVLDALASGSTRMTWHSDATAFRAPIDEFGARIEHFYATSIDGLKRLLSR